MSLQTSTDQVYAKPWQAREETTEGTFMTTADGGATLYTQIYGQMPFVTKASIKVNNSYRDVSQVGREDISAIKRGKKNVEFSVTMQASDTYKSFLKYLTNAAAYLSPSTTPAKSLSIFFSKYVDSAGTLTETFYKFSGARIKTSTWSLKEDGDWEIAADFVALNVDITTTALGGAATYQTAFVSEETYDFDSGGANHITFKSNNLAVKEFSATFDRKTSVDQATGNRIGHSSKTHGRKIGGTIKILMLGLTQWTDFNSSTESDNQGTLAVVVKTGQLTLTFTGAVLKDLTEDHDTDGTEATVHTFGWSCTGFTNI